MNNTCTFLLFFTLLLFSSTAFAQEKEPIPLFSLQMPDTLHKKRFWVSAGAGAVIYGIGSFSCANAGEEKSSNVKKSRKVRVLFIEKYFSKGTLFSTVLV